MTEKPAVSVSEDEARRFIERHGLNLGAAHFGAMAEAMGKIAEAGHAVPRVASKLDAPAPVFLVAAAKA